MKVDAHQHFWKYNKEELSWIDDSMSVIRRDFLPEHLLPELEKKGFQACVAVQTRQSEEENHFLLGLAKKHSLIKGVVGWLDLQVDNIQEKLEEYAKNYLFKGLRHIVQAEADPEFLLRPQFLNGIGYLKDFNLTYDILIFPQHLPTATKFVSLFPDQKFVLDHLAKPDIKNLSILSWKDDIKRIAAFSNVSCKLSGMVTEASWEYWKTDDFKAYVDVVLESFGTKRLMVGSDWPVCLVAAKYGEVVEIVEELTNQLSDDEKDLIFGQNAINFYNLK